MVRPRPGRSPGPGAPRRGGLRAALLAALAAAGCRDPMLDHGRLRPLEPSAFFADGRSARDPVPGTVPREGPSVDSTRRRVDLGGADELPFPLTRAVLERGEERYDIYCSVCHGRSGHGDGMIVRRGFTPPPSFHIPRLREAALGYFVEVTSNGLGAMFSYADRVAWDDRWAIAAHIRVLQLSQHAELAALPPEDAGKVGGRR